MNDNLTKVSEKSILELARGAFIERADYEMSRIIENILDPNTKATAKRKLTLTVEFQPDDIRTTIGVNVTAKSSLASTNPVATSLYIAGGEGGAIQAVEMVPQIPGQFDFNSDEQEAPAILKLVSNG